MFSAFVPFKHQGKAMRLLKGEATLIARRHIALHVSDQTIAALRRPLRVDRPDLALMQQLHDAGIVQCPTSGMPIFNPRECTQALQAAIWKAYCGVSKTVNTKVDGDTSDALETLGVLLKEHVVAPVA